MKKIFLLAATLFAFANVNAQENEGFKGKWFLMGQAGYGTSNDGDSQNYSILPAVGNFIAPTVAVGGAIGYIGTKDDLGDKNVNKTNAFVVQPLVRKYWGVSDKLFIFKEFIFHHSVFNLSDVSVSKFCIVFNASINFSENIGFFSEYIW
mgnify:CR=1 FL=1